MVTGTTEKTKLDASMALWYTPVIPALGTLRQEELMSQAGLGYIGRPYLKKRKEENQTKFQVGCFRK
jgi:hypothetical protein